MRRRMTLRSILLRPGDTAELAWLLASEALPTDDLNDQDRSFFRLEDEDGLVGFAGWEGEGRDRLLRSLVLAPARRRQGLGRATLAEVERQALTAEVARLHLLTTTAAPFFRAHGYRDADRADAPPSIRSSREFSSLCPATATYLVKRLSDGKRPAEPG